MAATTRTIPNFLIVGLSVMMIAACGSVEVGLESLRDSGQVIRIWGELTVGVPDWNGTQINVTRLELVD
jgi:hypothetical protein